VRLRLPWPRESSPGARSSAWSVLEQGTHVCAACHYGDAFELETASGVGPTLNVTPVPDECGFECRYWFREVGVAPSPFVDDLRSFNGEPLRDFVCADEVA